MGTLLLARIIGILRILQVHLIEVMAAIHHIEEVDALAVESPFKKKQCLSIAAAS
jgi:hypothetical protein